MGREGEHEYRAIHARFARNVVMIYAAAAVVGLGALIAAVASDLRYQQVTARDAVLLETQQRAQYLGRYLSLLSDEVQRLGERPEIDLLDKELGPEQRLLASSHDRSAIFNRGVALLDRHGARIWAAPESFLRDVAHPVSDAVLTQLTRASDVQFIPSSGNNPNETVLYVAIPIRQQHEVTGVLLGAIDLVAARAVDTGVQPRAGSEAVLATQRGELLFPPDERGDVALSHWVANHVAGGEDLVDAELDRPVVVAAAEVPNTRLVLMSIVDTNALDAPARRRLLGRLLVGVGLAAFPIVGLSLMLTRSLRSFRRAEDEAISAERMQSLGAAASLIAHEVRNSLNSLRLGLDVVTSEATKGSSRREDILTGLRGEMQRLSDFTTQLLTFSKGVVPNRRPLELAGFVDRVVATIRPEAEERGVRLVVARPPSPIHVSADASLVHVVLSNTIGNALHFASDRREPVVTVDVGLRGSEAVVRVVDNGPGVDAAVKRRLFEPFVTGRSNGVGIGLALARRIARAHGGDLALVPQDAGACFELTIPGARG